MARTEVGIAFKAYDQASREIRRIRHSFYTLKGLMIGIRAGYLGVPGVTAGIGEKHPKANDFAKE